MFKLAQHDQAIAVGQQSLTPRAHAARLFTITICLLLAAAAALWIDLPVAEYFRRQRLPGDFVRLVRLAEVFGWGGSVAIIIAIATTLDSRRWRAASLLAASSLGAGIIADTLKLLIARRRPMGADFEQPVTETFAALLPIFNKAALGEKYGYALQSFPSAHAATAAGLAASLSLLYPRGRWLFAGLAVLACLQRVEAQAHFCSDVLTGAALGCVVAAISGLLLSPSAGPAVVTPDSGK